MVTMPRTSDQGRSTAAPSATTSVEDYAKVIYGLSEWDGADPTAGAIARSLGVSNPSVTLMIRKMADLGLVDYRPYSPVRLTEEGQRLALSMVRRHRLIETWLVREMDYDWAQVHQEAERLEHAVSQMFVDRLAQRLGHPEVDPHGDPIPSEDLVLRHPETTLLCRVPGDSQIRVEQVDDSVPEALSFLAERQMTIGSRMQVLSARDGSVVLLDSSGENIPVQHDVAHAVRVSLAA